MTDQLSESGRSDRAGCDSNKADSADDPFANGLRCKVCNVLSGGDTYVCACHLTCLEHDEDER